MRVRWRSAVMVLAVALVGCGGGGGGSDDAVGPAPTGPGADTATARTVVLQQADMPAGWQGVPHSEDQREVDRARELSHCIGRPDPESVRRAIVYGPDLTMAATQVSSVATVLNTVEDAHADLDAVRGPKYGQCVLAALTQSLQQQAPDARVEDATVEPLPVDRYGDGSVGVRLTADLVYPDRTDHLFADFVYISKDRATVSATFFSFGQLFPAALEQALVSRMGNRIQTA